MKPQISVIMIAYNMGKYIGESIQSVLNQSFTDFELLILDDCSTDNTAKVVATFQDDRIQYHRATKNQGIPFMRNWGLELMKGKYMAILDSDDIAPPYRLQEQFDYMESHPEVGVLGGDVFAFGERNGYHESLQGNERIQYYFLFRCPIANPAAMVRKSVIDECQVRYDTEYPVCTDYKFWMELLNRTTFCNLTGKPYLFYRISHSESITTETMKAEKIERRDEIVGGMRFLFFKQFGFEVDVEEYRNFLKFFSYKKHVCTEQEYERLTMFLDELIRQGEVLMSRPDIWNDTIEHWRKYAQTYVRG